MCPGHLVNIWKREIINTIPDANAKIIENISDLLSLRRNEKPQTYEYYIISKEKAKLGYSWIPAFRKSRINTDVLFCPDCNKELLDNSDIPLSEESLEKSKTYCNNCKSPLWQADNSRLRRFAVSEYIKKFMKGYFDFFIADEVHELKGGKTAQGNSFGALASACNKTIALTGTLLGGYADDIFYILYRLSPKTIKLEKINYNDVSDWIAKYGVLERITKTNSEDNVCSRGKKPSVRISKKPGISPLVFSRHLINKSAFINLEDIALDLPEITEHVISVNMNEKLAEAYSDLESTLAAAVKSELARGRKTLLGTYLVNLLSYPDRPFDNPSVIEPDTGNIIITPEKLSKNDIYNKENTLLELITKEISENKHVFVYCQYTNTRDVTSRLKHILTEKNITTDILTSYVKPEKREEWINSKVSSGTKVIIANPKLVETGLDLYDFPTLIFYQTGYSIFTLRQASRRSWRIGQTKPVNIYYMYYKNTMQEKAMQLMGRLSLSSVEVESDLHI